MYSLLLSLAIAVGIALAWILPGLWGGSVLGVFFALVAFVATWVVINRRLARRLTPLMHQVQSCNAAGSHKAAINLLEQILPYGKWVPFLTGQLHGQIGILSHHRGDPKQGRKHLELSGPRSTDAQMLLASLQFRAKDAAAAMRTLERAALVNRRHALLPNVQAFLLHEQGRTDEAIAVLNRFLKREPGHEASKDNLLRLQNGRRLNMKSFDMQWYSLGLEDPPASMGVMQTGRKGFRTPPKKRGG